MEQLVARVGFFGILLGASVGVFLRLLFQIVLSYLVWIGCAGN